MAYLLLLDKFLYTGTIRVVYAMKPSTPHIIIDPAIDSTSFACDLNACKGACCTLPGGRGAPLLDTEAESLKDVLPVVRETLSSRHQEVLAARGPIEGPPGDLHTTCVDDAACVFVTYEDSVAKCAIEKAYFRGETTWRKPISCHLFPIRIDTEPVARMRFEYIPECSPALQKGAAEGTTLLSFLSEPLQRVFGESASIIEKTARR
jgi:hypothetical protein